MSEHTRAQCEAELVRVHPVGEGTDGQLWRCTCGSTWVHICDEAEGCAWWPAND